MPSTHVNLRRLFDEGVSRMKSDANSGYVRPFHSEILKISFGKYR